MPLGAIEVPISFRMSCFFEEILADVVVKKRIKDEMSKIFVHLFLYTIGWFDRRIQYITSIGLFYKNWGFYLEGV